MRLNKRIYKAVERQGWRVERPDGSTVRLSCITRYCDEYCVCVDAGRFVEEIRELARAFDPDEYVADCIGCGSRGHCGVPNVRMLLEIADDIDDKIRHLADAVWQAA